MQPKIIAKRIRNNLINQKKKLEDYLILLEKQNEDILKDDPDELIAYINIENNIINNLTSFKKILTPVELMYHKSPLKKDNDLVELRSCIDLLSSKVLKKADEKKKKLDEVLENVKLDLKGFSKKKKLKSSFENIKSQVVDISG